jgi:hypothetical protein
MTSLKDHGVDSKLVLNDPSIACPEDVDYIASVVVEE